MIPTPKTTTIAGVGSPVVDHVARVPEAFVQKIEGEKGGMELVDAETLENLLAALPEPAVRVPGGSAGNTAFALARMGMPCRFLGVAGDDYAGTYYRRAFALRGGDAGHIRIRKAMPTAQCLSLVTPDGERTMRTHLGAAASMTPADVVPEDFAECTHVHVEGYLLFNPDLMTHVLQAAKGAGCSTSVDLASFEVVAAAGDGLPELLGSYVDMVFANEDEAEAYAGGSGPDQGLECLAYRCNTVAVKHGAQGAVLCVDGRVCHIPAHPVEAVVDTTGAGDLWAAGFLFGICSGREPEHCGALASTLGAAVVQHQGAAIPDSRWKEIAAQIAR